MRNTEVEKVALFSFLVGPLLPPPAPPCGCRRGVTGPQPLLVQLGWTQPHLDHRRRQPLVRHLRGRDIDDEAGDAHGGAFLRGEDVGLGVGAGVGDPVGARVNASTLATNVPELASTLVNS